VSLGSVENGGDIEIPATIATVVSTSRATTLGSSSAAAALASRRSSNGADAFDLDPGNAKIATVEHLLATLFALEIDNVRVEVDGAEIPAMDGSAAHFVDWVRSAERERQNSTRRELAVVKPFEIRDGDRWIRIEPADALRISYAIDFAHPCIGRQSLEIPYFDGAVFERDLARARTFGFADEVEELRNAGLARGGSLGNTVVLDETRVLNSGGLRWPDEFVRHKITDLLGDLALLGASLAAHIRVEKGGHRLHHQLVRALVEEPGLVVDRSGERSIESDSELTPARALGRS
jgi:UDP-3-O-[3-hydroxymyristoyl] N-acetylglucosamine deacetylase